MTKADISDRIRELETEIWRKKLVSGRNYGVIKHKGLVRCLYEPTHVAAIIGHHLEIRALQEVLKYMK